ncbi:hypothetical protein ABEV54_17065 [Peribacillus psychrosaccharolyticus]|uniref:hypothetical protein n=1 Tax=Peribacillus psychrosaccharolyticus TaxID=1407 RepID=UPI003D2C75A0
MFKLLSINLLPVVIIHFLFFFLTQNTRLDISFLQLLFELFTSFLLLIMNYKMAVKKEKTYFIPNFFLILISSLLGVALGYLSWGLDASGYTLQNDLGVNILQNPDAETYGIVMLEAQINVILSIVGSLLCSIILIVKNRKKRSLK